jgi:hypothetical protein
MRLGVFGFVTFIIEIYKNIFIPKIITNSKLFFFVCA